MVVSFILIDHIYPNRDIMNHQSFLKQGTNIASGAVRLKLSMFFKVFLTILDISILVTIIVNFSRDLMPRDQPVFWIGVVVEILIGFVAYWFWMRSILVQGFSRDRIISIVLVLSGILLPFAIQLSDLKVLKPAINSDVFFFVTLISLIIYSSFIIEKSIVNTRKRESRYRSK